ncbi:single-stranded DNA-binding protein [Bogoriella caseilytica]|uniref:Single-stranded DNA-binding protein n=1 Tax=Bogoriella caseilytica TaxID=56055 RepID=A0A3N2BF90_9MICO|nr:single-stranded DNA-binding protein [Bogoriella caseilytica]ROR73870.1 single-strand DNA-binding protein [Bogoriella caseilytica]
MSNEIEIAFTGFLAEDPKKIVAGENTYAEFRVGSTSRYFSRDEQEYVDRPTTWLTVKAWRELGENVVGSLRKGHPVLVRGELRTETWKNSDGENRSKEVVIASAVGPNLRLGTAAFTRTIRQSAEGGSGSASDSEHITATAARLAGAAEGQGARAAKELSSSPHSSGVEDSQWEARPEPAGAA